MSNVAETSRENYYKEVLSGRAKNNRERIIRWLLKHEPRTRHEISKHLGIPIQTVTGRVASIICREEGCDHSGCRMYVEVDHVGDDPVTHNTAQFLRMIRPQPEAREMQMDLGI